MKLTTDDAFRIGNSHLRTGTPCQDYTLSGSADGYAYAVVSDGCGSGARTDLGARLYCLAAAKSIAEAAASGNVMDEAAIEVGQKFTVRDASATLGLGARDLLATSAYAVVSEQGALVRIRGDGVACVAWHDGRVDLVRTDWAGNAPAYPSYGSDGYAAFIAAQGGPEAEAFTVEWKGGVEVTERLGVSEGIRGFSWWVPPEELKAVRAIAVFTDGVTQVDGHEWHEAATEMLAFKGTNGDFAKRRLGGFLRSAEKDGRKPQDDIGYAVVLLEE